MNWTTWLIVAAVLVLLLVLKRAGQLPAGAAAEYLKQGAMVIDVRTPGEFASGHLKRAVNMPLNEIETMIVARVRDKEQVLLLHCQSGMRSGVAKKKLAAMGYTNVFNLGSYQRAASIVNGAAGTA